MTTPELSDFVFADWPTSEVPSQRPKTCRTDPSAHGSAFTGFHRTAHVDRGAYSGTVGSCYCYTIGMKGNHLHLRKQKVLCFCILLRALSTYIS